MDYQPNLLAYGLAKSKSQTIGIIVPELHYGRDALIGIALFLTHLAKFGKSIKTLRNSYPDYFISKNKIELDEKMNVQEIFKTIKEKYKEQLKQLMLESFFYKHTDYSG